MTSLPKKEWEEICSGCGKCCLHKLEDSETGQIWQTIVACRQLDIETVRCRNYPDRKKFVPTCVNFFEKFERIFDWLPETCSYRLIAEGIPLPPWHHFVCGNREEIHKAGGSVAGFAISENDIDLADLEDYIW